MHPIIRAYQRAFLHVYGWAAERLYDELAWAYDPVSTFVSAGRWSVWRALALDYVTGPRVLELGFGTGELLTAMRQRGLTVVGLDLSRAMHRAAGRKLAARGLVVPRVQARAEALPFGSARFDTVVATFPAGYILQPATLNEVARVLAPGGRLVIVGLIVKLPRSLRYPLSVIPGGPWEKFWAYFERVAAQSGLLPTLTWREDGAARVPVVICSRAGERT